MSQDNVVKIDKDLQDLIPKFLANLKRDISLLEVSIGKKDFSTAQQIAHRLRGDAPGYGFMLVGEICAELDEICKGSGPFDRCLPLITDLVKHTNQMQIVYT